MDERSGNRLAVVLWFVAAVLALAAAGVTYPRNGEIRWPILAAGLFLLGMGISALRRSGARGARVVAIFLNGAERRRRKKHDGEEHDG